MWSFVRRLSEPEQNGPTSNALPEHDNERLSVKDTKLESNKNHVDNNREVANTEEINEIEDFHYHANEYTATAFDNTKLSSSINSIDLNLYM